MSRHFQNQPRWRREYRRCAAYGLAALLLAAALPLSAAQAAPGDLRFTIPHPHGAVARSEFGSVLESAGDFLIIGAPRDFGDPAFPGALTGRGTLYIFNMSGAQPVLQHVIRVDALPGDVRLLGASLAELDAGRFIVGAPESQPGGGAVGRAFIMNAASGTLVSEVPNPSTNLAADFGAAVSRAGLLGNGGAAVGAPGAECAAGQGGQPIGAVFLSNTGGPSILCSPPPVTTADFFGRALAGIGDDRLAVSVNVPARVMIYRVGTGDLLFELEDPLGGGSSTFGGFLVEKDATTVLASDMRNSRVYGIDVFSGAIVFEIVGPPGSVSFGAATAVDGDRILIADKDALNDNGVRAGRVYVYDAASGALLHTYDSPTPDTASDFGQSITVLDNGDYAIGERGPPGASSTGVVYIFEAPDPCTDPALPDADGDGVADICDVCPGFDDNADADGDGAPDACDVCPGGDDNTDSDGDGVPDDCDQCPGFDDNLDSDGDGVPDDCDICPGSDDNLDADGDGAPDDCDLCPGFDDNLDADGDGEPDGCDICPLGDDNEDGDGDGVPDACDRCPGSDDNLDADGDGVPDDCDVCPGGDDNADSDGDTVPDACDACPGADDNADNDGDGVPDGCDRCPGRDDGLDADDDGVPNGCDICPGGDDNVDSDGDGVPDDCELLACQADLNANGSVDFEDLAVLLANFDAADASRDQGDIDGDGLIEIADLALLLSVFEETCP